MRATYWVGGLFSGFLITRSYEWLAAHPSSAVIVAAILGTMSAFAISVILTVTDEEERG